MAKTATKKKTTSKNKKKGTRQVKKRTASQLKKNPAKQIPQNTQRISKTRRHTGVKYGAGCKYFLDENAFVIKENANIK